MAQKKILIIHLSRLGDMVQSLPAVKLFKADYPESEITYFGIEQFCDPLKDIPWIDNLLTVSSRDINGILTEDADMDLDAFDRLFHKIPELGEHYDVLINMTHNRGSSYLSSRITAAEKRGRTFSKENEMVMAGNWAKYLFAVAGNRNDNLLNLVDLYTGMMGVRNRPVTGYLPTNVETDRRSLTRLTEHSFDPEKLTVGFQLGASKSLRTWPPEYFIGLGELLCEQLNAQIILFGSERERVLADQFHDSAPFPFIDLMGKTTLSELPSFLKQCHVLVSNDTGPMHIAAAVGTTVVGIFMSTAFFRITGPYGKGHIAIQSNYPCAPCLDSTICSQPLCGRSILPETVLPAVKWALGLETESFPVDDCASFYSSDFDRNGTVFYKRLDDKKDHFLPWLRFSHDNKARINQSLWNQWLGLKTGSARSESNRDTSDIDDLLEDYEHACLSHGKLNEQGEKACQKIIEEFQKAKPRIEFIQNIIAHIEQVEQNIKHIESPLAFFKEIHELFSAETEYCDFPKLAHEFLKKYRTLNDIIHGFKIRINQISAAVNKESDPNAQHEGSENFI